ncbi:MAG: ATP-binding cassette domain-containing protein [Candidatus Methanomethylicus sp.]|nr:ATP-binding cassette domain-containing protein [Candidatus Methanomethylicus sp.]
MSIRIVGREAVSKMDLAVDAIDVIKTYDRKTRALDQVTLQVEAGTVFALLGPNGSGKTTLMRILTTQLSPDSGKTSVLGHDTVRESAKVRQLVGYVPQEMSVWTDISGYENLLIYAKIYGIPSDVRKRLIMEALENIDLSDFADRLVKSYSGGMIRRLEIASALLISPKILFLDEPTIGLDPMARKTVWEKLTSFKKEYGTTVFFNTHYMDEADLYADRIGIISRGKIIKTGSVSDLKHSVGGEILILSLEQEKVEPELIEKIRVLPLVEEIVEGDSEISLVTEDAEASLPGIMKLLDSSGVAIRRVSMNEPTLDDVFLKYAGTRLETATRLNDIKQVRGMIKRG